MPSKWRNLVATYGQTLKEKYENIGLAIFYIQVLLKAKKLLRERVKGKKKKKPRRKVWGALIFRRENEEEEQRTSLLVSGGIQEDEENKRNLDFLK